MTTETTLARPFHCPSWCVKTDDEHRASRLDGFLGEEDSNYHVAAPQEASDEAWSVSVDVTTDPVTGQMDKRPGVGMDVRYDLSPWQARQLAAAILAAADVADQS